MAKSNLSSQAPYLVIVAVVAVVAVVSLVLNGSGTIQGAEVGRIITPEEDRVQSCIDTDSDNNPLIKGYTQIGIVKYDDFCNGDILHQSFCENGDVAMESRITRCDFGCERGRCCTDIRCNNI